MHVSDDDGLQQEPPRGSASKKSHDLMKTLLRPSIASIPLPPPISGLLQMDRAEIRSHSVLVFLVTAILGFLALLIDVPLLPLQLLLVSLAAAAALVIEGGYKAFADNLQVKYPGTYSSAVLFISSDISRISRGETNQNGGRCSRS